MVGLRYGTISVGEKGVTAVIRRTGSRGSPASARRWRPHRAGWHGRAHAHRLARIDGTPELRGKLKTALKMMGVLGVSSIRRSPYPADWWLLRWHGCRGFQYSVVELLPTRCKTPNPAFAHSFRPPFGYDRLRRHRRVAVAPHLRPSVCPVDPTFCRQGSRLTRLLDWRCRKKRRRPCGRATHCQMASISHS
jgi:hypothetical protein